MSPERENTSEHIGKYRVHPVANMFPLLTGEEFENFKRSILDRGQLEPIIVQGELLLDGRNRLRACIDCKREPKVREFEETDALVIASYIVTQNMHRRHLTKEQQIMIAADANKWMITERNRRRKIQAGKEGGRGNRKTLLPNGSKVSGSAAKSRERNARSTIGRVAALAESSHRQAAASSPHSR